MGQRSYKKRQWVQVIFPTEWRKWSKKWPKIKGGKWRNMQLHYSSTFLMRIQQQWPPSSQVLLASNFFMISFYERMNGAVHGYKVTKWWSLFLSSSFFFLPFGRCWRSLVVYPKGDHCFLRTTVLQFSRDEQLATERGDEVLPYSLWCRPQIHHTWTVVRAPIVCPR